MRICLCYHAVSERWPADLSVTPGALRAQLTKLVERGYSGTTFTELTRSDPGGKLVAVTFDDSYESVAALARPILDDLGLPGTVFVPTAYAGSGEPMSWPGIDRWVGTEHERELMPMGWERLRELAGAGWEIGSHTATHPHLTEIDGDRLTGELGESKAAVEQNLGRPCTSIAYPYGDHDGAVVAATAAAGYEAAGTLPKRFPRAEPLRWPRVGVYHGDDERRFAMKVSPAMLRLRSSPLWVFGG